MIVDTYAQVLQIRSILLDFYVKKPTFLQWIKT